MTTGYIQAFYEKEKRSLVLPHDFENLPMEKRNGNEKSFAGVFQLFSDKIATTLKSTALLAYPVHTIF